MPKISDSYSKKKTASIDFAGELCFRNERKTPKISHVMRKPTEAATLKKNTMNNKGTHRNETKNIFFMAFLTENIFLGE